MTNRPEETNNTEDAVFFTVDEPQVTEPVVEPIAEPAIEEATPVATEADAAVSLGDKAALFEQAADGEEDAPVSLSEYGDVALAPAPEQTLTPVKTTKSRWYKPKNKAERRAWSWFKGLTYTIVVVGISLTLTYLIVGGLLDVTGLQKSDLKRRVDIPEGATTADVADALEEAELIDHPMIFRVYSRFTGADGTFQPGTFYLSANMGYSELVRFMQEIPYRESVTITIPEGSTVEQVARLLSGNGVCEYDEFYTALLTSNADDYGFAFLKDVPRPTDAGFEDRIYWLEGYLFPDTYDFYQGISGEDAIAKLLENFELKMKDWQEGIAASGYTMDEVMILASIVQGESADTANMPKVARVLLNRMENYAEYPYLQMDSTGDYIDKLSSTQGSASESAYNTYTHMGLPPGPINNPSLAAIQAVISPSKDEHIMKCYYFANDDARNTYYSITYEEHVAICQKHNIGIHAN